MGAGGTFDPRGPVADEILDLTWVLTGLGVAVFVVFATALAYSFRPGRAVDPGRAAVRWIVAGGVAMPVAVLLITFGFTAEAMRDTPERAPAGSLRVDVIGHQWWYELRYPDHGIVTANEMHIPAGRPVEVHLTSADVIHSFWVPELAGKLDLLPDRENVLVIQADEAGEYRGSCAEFCGLQHAKMRIVVVAADPPEFSAWLRRQQRPAVPPDNPVAQRGKEVFAAAGCSSCHTIEGTPARGSSGPDLTHLAGRRTLASATMPNTRRHLIRWLTEPQDVKAGTQMESADLAAEEMKALVTYLEALD